MDMETYQVTEASSDALNEIYNGVSSLSKMTFSDMIMPSPRKDIDDDEIIYIPERTVLYVFEGKKFVFAATTSVHGDDALVVDGGRINSLVVDRDAISTITKSFDSCTQIQPTVNAIQTASDTTAIYTSHVCSKTYIARDKTEVPQPTMVKEYIVIGIRYDLLSVKGLNEAGYRVIHDKEEHKPSKYAVI